MLNIGYRMGRKEKSSVGSFYQDNTTVVMNQETR